MEKQFERLARQTEKIKDRYDEAEELISMPEIIADNRLYRRLVSENAANRAVVEKRAEMIRAAKEAERCGQELLTAEGDIRTLLFEEEKKQREKAADAAEELSRLLFSDRDEECEIVVEIRVSDMLDNSLKLAFSLFSMYLRASERMGFLTRTEKTYMPRPEMLKSATFTVAGKGAYGSFRYESGAHRYTESRRDILDKTYGTAYVTVYKKPWTEEIEFGDKDIRIDLFHSGGAGGQNINKVETAIRVTHLPTGIVVTCQDERSQFKNKERALANLKEKLKEIEDKRRESEIDNARNEQKAASKGVPIRIYNAGDNTVEDLRCEVTLPMDVVLDGGIEGFCEALRLI
ncbi:MAG: PCRF domain-containing protein [Clostridiales bacterium]|nr:PCRF domain-containing protein [Clostridiales bacterium]